MIFLVLLPLLSGQTVKAEEKEALTCLAGEEARQTDRAIRQSDQGSAKNQGKCAGWEGHIWCARQGSSGVVDPGERVRRRQQRLFVGTPGLTL